MSEPSKPQERISRRVLLSGLGAVGLAAGMGAVAKAAYDPKAPKQRPVIEGYADQLSVEAGDEIGLCVSTSSQTYAVEIARVGLHRQVVWTKSGLRGAQYEVPENVSSHGCRWPVALRVPVSKEWRSGYYSVMLRATDSDVGGPASEGEAFFVVRSAHPGRDTSILIQLCTNTYAGYNDYGGSNFYGGPRTWRVSFDRPYQGFADPKGFTARYSGWRNWEQHFVEWAERAGYRMDYAVNTDLEFYPEILGRYRLVLSVGHDEYWSSSMRDYLEVFIQRGGNVAFFSGNTAFWQVRSESGGRALVCWKEAYDNKKNGDPVYGTSHQNLLTAMYCDRLVGRPENSLTGVSFAWAGYHDFGGAFPDGDRAYTVHRPDHWIFEGTGLKRGDLLGQKVKLVGYECDGCEIEWKDGLPFPTLRDGTPESFQILGTTPAALSEGDRSISRVADALYGRGSGKKHPQPGYAVLGSYTRGDSTVVTSGCTEWSNGLRSRDRQVDRITRNILDRLSR